MAVILLSTAYLPPVEYFYRISRTNEVLIENQENFLKQTYRNRCYISSANGIIPLTVPVYLGSFHKTPVRDIRIDYSKRWQQVHLRAIRSSYSSAPYFIYYFESIEKIILSDYKFLIDLNMELIEVLIKIAGLKAEIQFTDSFKHPLNDENDFRYSISPKKLSGYVPKQYIKVFGEADNIRYGISIIDLVFNAGPETASYL